ncbi:RabGAP/TBC, partial [Coemansia reversa NRRL 1564]
MHPLSQDEDSPWTQYQRDHSLRHTIAQDVARTFPTESYFRQTHVQQQLSDILLVQAKANGTLQYRQGMHELLAVLLIAVDGDAGATEPAGELRGVLDRRFVEHDAFALFERVMQTCGPWYQ